MRDPNRLYDFYNTLMKVHMENFPDWRFGQFMSNFLGWVYSEKSRDIFFPEEDEMKKYIEEYAKLNKRWG